MSGSSVVVDGKAEEKEPKARGGPTGRKKEKKKAPRGGHSAAAWAAYAEDWDEEWYDQLPQPSARHFHKIEGGRVCQALHIDSKSVLDALCRVKKCFRRSM